MPLRNYDSTDYPGVAPLQRPEDFVGWVDSAHLEEMTQADESVVHRWQNSLGLPLSKFGSDDGAAVGGREA